MNANAMAEGLHENIKLLGNLLGKTIIQQEGRQTFDLIENTRQLAVKAAKGDQQALIEIINKTAEFSEDNLATVTLACAQFLHLINVAQECERNRHYRVYLENPESYSPIDSLRTLLPKLIKQGFSAEKILNTIQQFAIELVLTAHPTEVRRRTIMHKYKHIVAIMEQLDNKTLAEQDIKKCHMNILSELTAIWQTPLVRWVKPTAEDEANWGFDVVEQSLWRAVPNFIRELDTVLEQETGLRLPIDCMPVTFGSWMGGDRDGNPNVTAALTRKISYLSRRTAAKLYLKDIKTLQYDLSMTDCSHELRSIVADSAEPYREILAMVLKKLRATVEWAEACTESAHSRLPGEVYEDPEQLLAPLLLCYYSLQEVNAEPIANGMLLDVIRRVNCFGLNLYPLDIRQDASKHQALMSAITQVAGLGCYADWKESQKQQFLIQELENVRPLFSKEIELPAELQEVLDTFYLISELPKDSIRSYIISMASVPSDILAVQLLLKEAAVDINLPIIPLFETLADLDKAADCLNALFNIPLYLDSISSKQEVMIGYSDSAKDAGIMAAVWLQYTAQEKILAIAKQHQVSLTFFHGRGGSVGRGGWPTHAAITALPEGSVNSGKLRVTQQGEVISMRFGQHEVALRTMESYLTATLESCLFSSVKPIKPWRTMMDHLAQISTAAYQEKIQDSQFLDYFVQGTPIKEFEHLAIGSRPQKRANGNDVTQLRAIPWVFAWNQNRLLLPAWLGIGHALDKVLKENKGQVFKDMLATWPFFHTFLCTTEFTLAQGEPWINYFYEQQLVESSLHAFGEQLREDFACTRKCILHILEQEELLAKDASQKRHLQYRQQYLLLMHVMQVELLKRNRLREIKLTEEMFQPLFVSIAGIAAGMQNTG